MIGQQKPLASLSSTLLARKGQARPAMRPQGFGGFGTIPGAQDDLGWNDMGHAMTAYEPSYESAPEPVAPVPPVLVQREALTEEIEDQAEIVLRPVSVATAQRIGRETGARHAKAAFTLRLDHDRHLRLRLACALHNRSAQHLVTEALDAFLEQLPEVDALARQIPLRAKN